MYISVQLWYIIRVYDPSLSRPFVFSFFFLFFVLTRNNKFVQRVTVVRQTNFEADFVCCVSCYNRATYACKYVIILVS